MPFIINQNRYSIFGSTIEENGLKAWQSVRLWNCRFSALWAQGLLTDKYLHGIPETADKERRKILHESGKTEETLGQISALNEITGGKRTKPGSDGFFILIQDGEVTSRP